MLRALTLLVVCQFAGEVLGQILSIPLPGPVIGLLLLLVGLMVRYRAGTGVAPELRTTAGGLLSNLSLLFVPAGVGVVTQLAVLRDNLLALLVATLVSTVLGLAVTGWVMQRLARPDGPPAP